MSMDVTGSIVLYKANIESLGQAIDSFLNCKRSIHLYLIDNSPTDELRTITNDPRVTYIFNNANLGFGVAHNIAIQRSLSDSKYHLVLNPDVRFDEGTLEHIFDFMEKNQEVGQLLPKVLYNNGNLQKLCKLLPTPYDLLGRRFFKDAKWTIERSKQYELGNFSYDTCLNVPNLSGCFMFLRNSVLRQTGGFDPRFFMYLEDIDLTRRMHKLGKTLFYPYVHIFHGYEKGSYSDPKLLKYHIVSAIKYFNKWGWLFDKERTAFNNRVTKAIETASLAK